MALLAELQVVLGALVERFVAHLPLEEVMSAGRRAVVGVLGVREPFVRKAVDTERLLTTDEPPDEEGHEDSDRCDQEDVHDDREEDVLEHPVPDCGGAIAVHGARIHLLPLEEF